jgi:hypothetical protein
VRKAEPLCAGRGPWLTLGVVIFMATAASLGRELQLGVEAVVLEAAAAFLRWGLRVQGEGFISRLE